MRIKKKDEYGIPRKACFLFVDETGRPITKVWICGCFVFYRNYTKNIMKRAFGRKRIVSVNDVKRFLYSRSIPNSRNMRSQTLGIYGLDPTISHWDFVKAVDGKTMSDEYSIIFF